MRYKPFVTHVAKHFPVTENHDLAVDIADALSDASRSDRGNIGCFWHAGVTYYVESKWLDGCINGDCNPATCYTDWTITPELDKL